MEALKTLGYEIDVNEKEAKGDDWGHGTQIPSRQRMCMSEVPERRHVF